MKKKVFAAVTAVVIGFSMIACGPVTESADGKTAEAAEAETDETEAAETKTFEPETAEEETAAVETQSSVTATESTAIAEYSITARQFLKSEDYYTIAYGSYETLTLSEEARKAYPALEATLRTVNANFAVKAKEDFEEIEDYATDAWNALAEKSYDFPSGEMTREIEPVRQDSKFLSFYIEFYGYYSGAAHGFTLYEGYNFDTATGRALTLQDVFKDPASLKPVLAENLRTAYDGEPVNDVDDLLDSYFADGMERLVWVIDNEGVTFRFAPGDLSYYAAGIVESKISYAGNEDLFTDLFAPVPGAYVRYLSPYNQTLADLDGDGQPEEIGVTPVYDIENSYAYWGVTVTAGEQELTVEDYFFGMVPVLLHTEDGRNYIYAVVTSDNDYNNLMVFDLNEGSPKLAGTLHGTGIATYFYYDDPDMERNYTVRQPIFNPDSFPLHTRMNLMSTYSAKRNYSVGEDGLPAPLTEYYEVMQPRTLVSKVPITAELVDKKTGELTGETIDLPAGTRCTLWHTNGVDTVDLTLEDARAIRLHVNKEWPQTVNGVELEEAFDGTMFAG